MRVVVVVVDSRGNDVLVLIVDDNVLVPALLRVFIRKNSHTYKYSKKYEKSMSMMDLCMFLNKPAEKAV